MKPSASESSTIGSMFSAWQASSAVSQRAHLRARVAGGELLVERRQRRAGGLGLATPARGQLAFVVGLGVVRHGLAVPQHPQLARHRAAALRGREYAAGSSKRQ